VRILLITLTLLCCGCSLRWQPPADSGSVPGDTVAVDDGWVRVQVQGPNDGPAVVLIHGFGSHLGVWTSVLPALDGYRVLRLDLLGFGESSRLPGDYSPEGQAAAVLAAMNAAGIDEAAVVAHSMGASIALTLAEQAPERVSRLVLLAPWVYDEQVPWAYRDARRPGIGELVVGLWHAEHLAWRFEYSFYDDAYVTEEILDSAREMLRRPGTRAAALATIRSLDLAGRQEGYVSVNQPVLVVNGREDQVSTLPYAERLVAQLPVARLEVLPWCGHLPMIEAPEQTRRLVRYWLSRGRP
jgi:pimeloyl-ACP methyl ester carboxylesterase